MCVRGMCEPGRFLKQGNHGLDPEKCKADWVMTWVRALAEFGGLITGSGKTEDVAQTVVGFCGCPHHIPSRIPAGSEERTRRAWML